MYTSGVGSFSDAVRVVSSVTKTVTAALLLMSGTDPS